MAFINVPCYKVTNGSSTCKSLCSRVSENVLRPFKEMNRACDVLVVIDVGDPLAPLVTVFKWICIKYGERRRDEGEYIYRDQK
jgi:hypothetical protein